MHRSLPYLSVACLGLISAMTLAAIEPSLWIKQLGFVVIGLVLMWLCERIPFSNWLSHRWWLYGLSIILLIAPFVLSHSSRNTARWIDLGFFNLQSSQLALPFVALVVVVIASSRDTEWQRIGKIFLSLIAPLGLVFLSPDLGTTVLMLVAFSSVFWFGRFSLRSIFLLVLGAGLVVGISWLLLLKPYQKERLLLFLQGSSREENVHYNALQSHIAIGSGGLFGQGFKEGTQVSLAFLPESHTDFWFASYAEQSGFLGVLLFFFLYILLCGELLRLAILEKEEKARLYILMCIVSVSSQIFVNSGMNLGLLPITGVTLPFLSYGGSSFLSLCVLMGITLSAGHQSPHVVQMRTWYNLPSALEK